jgi:hypothetical protein
MDGEGYENDIKTLAREILRARRVEEKLGAERRRLREEERARRLEEEGEEEEGEEEEEEDDDAVGELEELLIDLKILSDSKPVGSGRG